MATGGIAQDVEADDTVNKLTCAICLEKYRRPKILPCFHTFCQSCLQGVAGSSPSFPCPSCRTRVLLPPGGVGALQTNFYIEEDLATASLSPPRRLCDVCAEDREATHSCVQCQQRYCLPCRKYHDSFTLSRGHAVISLTEEEEKGCGMGISLSEKQDVEMCPKHVKQEILFHCSKCEADICMQCKLTQHEGHPTEDLADSRSKVKDKLKDKLGSLTQEIKQTDEMVSAFEGRCTQFQQQRKEMEQDFHARADTLHTWVNQSLDEAISNIQSCSKQLAKPWQDQAEQLRNKKRALQAQLDHILQVLKGGKEADFVSLEAQLSSSSLEDVNVKQLKRELTKDIPTFHVVHNTTAVNQLQLRTFIGVLEPLQQTPDPEDTVTPIQSCSVQGEASSSLSVKGSDLTHSTDISLSASSCVAAVVKKPPREFIYSKNPDSVVITMCPISHNRLWVLYRPAGKTFIGPRYLKLFDAEGQVLTTVENPINLRYLPITDTILSWAPGSGSAQLITPDGSLTSYDMETKIERFVFCATNNIHYMREFKKNSLHRVIFSFTSNDQAGKTKPDSTVPPPQSPVAPPLRGKLTHSAAEVVFEDIPSNRYPLHVSAGGRYFAFIESDKVEVYATAGSGKSAFICSYMPKKGPVTIRFCLIDGQEMLLVVVENDNKIHVIDHTDGGCFVRYLDTGSLKMDRPNRLATDFDQHVWIGCGGGKVVVVDL